MVLLGWRSRLEDGAAARTGYPLQLIRPDRDLRVDFFRGLALWWIFADHIPDNWIAQFSLRNFALCDATEVFVLLAGYAAGLAYGGSMDRHGWVYAAADVVKRAWTLYVVHIFLFVVFSAQVSFSATALDRSEYLEELGLDVLAEAPYRAMLEALTLHFQPAYLNILPLYIALLVMFIAMLPLLHNNAVLMSISLLLYVVARVANLNFPSWTGGGWYFNPLAWQVLFVIGANLAHMPHRLPRGGPALDKIAILIVALGFGLQVILWPNPDLMGRLPPDAVQALAAVDRESLHPLRLISILALAWLAARWVPIGAAWLRSRPAAPFVLCGQHSLPVFCVGIFLSFLGRLAMEQQPGWLVQALVNMCGALALVGVAALSAWYRGKGRAQAGALQRRVGVGSPS